MYCEPLTSPIMQLRYTYNRFRLGQLTSGNSQLVNYLVILYLTGLNYYGLLKPFFHLKSMCIYSQFDSTSLLVQRSEIKLF